MLIKEKLEIYTPIENVMNRQDDHFERLCMLYGWYIKKDLNANSTLKSKEEVLTNLFKQEKDGNVQYEYKNVYWQIELENFDFLFLYSQRGMEILVDKKIDKRNVEKILSYLEMALL